MGFGGGSGFSASPNNIQGDATISGNLTVGGTNLTLSSSAESILTIQSNVDCGIRLVADVDGTGGENDNPYIDFYQDGGTGDNRAFRQATIGMVGDPGEIFTDSLANAFFIMAAPSTNYDNALQIATRRNTDDQKKARITIENTMGFVGINTNAPDALLAVSGSEIAAMNLFQVESALDEGTNDPAMTINQNADGRWFMSVGTGPQTTYATQWNISNGSSNTLYFQNGNIYYGVGTNLVYQGPSVPASSTAAGATGQISYDSNYIYICTSGGVGGAATWKRVALSGF